MRGGCEEIDAGEIRPSFGLRLSVKRVIEFESGNRRGNVKTWVDGMMK
jgi:hypothetical protein